MKTAGWVISRCWHRAVGVLGCVSAGLAVRFAREMAREVLGCEEKYRLIQSGGAVRRVEGYHCHLIPLDSHAMKVGVYLSLFLMNLVYTVASAMR